MWCLITNLINKMKTMKNISLSLMAVALLPLLAACDDSPFKEESTAGQIKTRSLSVSVRDNDINTKASGVDLNEFTVQFVKASNNEVVETYAYDKMPEVVTLQTGDYKLLATNCTTPNEGEWDKPYYYGVSNEFSVAAGKVTTDIDPIVCKLSNIRVTVLFDENLYKQMTPDSHVAVNVGTDPEKNFSQNEECHYFWYAEGSTTVTARFQGTVGKDDVDETKTYSSGVAPGNHYKIKFSYNGIDVNGSGVWYPGGENEGDPVIKVTADINVKDTGNYDDVDFKDSNSQYMEDDRFPNGGDDPDDPNVPKGPTVSADDAPAEGKALDLYGWNVVDDDLKSCVLKFKSESGFTEFKVVIDSETLTPEILEGVGLSTNLDLVNPGSLEEAIKGLHLPVNVGGKKDCNFDITEFLPMLGIYGAADHQFRITVKDANGTLNYVLKLRTI